jgi:uncharacterized protein
MNYSNGPQNTNRHGQAPQGHFGAMPHAHAAGQGLQGMTQAQIDAESASFMRKVYGIMSGGLLLTAVVSLLTASSQTLMQFIYGNRMVFYGLLGLELLAVLGFSAIAARASSIVAGLLFAFYAFLNGLTLSFIFLIYTSGSIASTFFICSAMFAGMSAYGYVTKRDLTGVGSFAMMGLWGIIIASLVNLFMRSDALSWVVSMCGVVVFTALTAYDTQKIRELNVIGNAGTDEDNKEAIHGALVLYLDFINLFLQLLRLFGRRR